ncbi:FBP1 (YLR377C) [Zygosaccharomyces parabailii]|nr:FBP1 (YLR377C) [Zygosaccharomyces parabailii]CDH10769.1 probable Fructose-1,6-bisphosphatase [Zygosaccharomyces bailii ISA1307]
MPDANTEVSNGMTAQFDTDIITLPRFLLESQRTQTHSTGEFTLLLNSLGFAFKFISQTIRKAELVHFSGLAGTNNTTGDAQKKLDVLGDEIFINAMKSSGNVKVLVSEEQEDLIIFPTSQGTYAVCCDPIDGSSNLDAGVSVGTIVSIFRLKPGSTGSIQDVLRGGTEMVGACYAMYGASTHLLLTTGNGVDGFTLDNNIGEFILVYPELRLPPHNPIYSINEGNSYYWKEEVKSFIEKLKLPQANGKPFSARYVGSMVADMHRTFMYGGLFAYPGDRKSSSGKLRLLYEAFPMSFLVEQAGGIAVNDRGERILDLKPEHIHDKSSIWLGSKEDVGMYLQHIGKSLKK